MDPIYALTPLVAWFCAGVCKFAINSIRAGRLAVDEVGYGGMPSNHSAIVASPLALLVVREGWGHPAVGVGVALAFIVVLDASSLRRQIGRQAEAINRLVADNASLATKQPVLRERMGHRPVEIAAGMLLGSGVALAMDFIGKMVLAKL